jgi:type VII secretion integral membrane protein EccD
MTTAASAVSVPHDGGTEVCRITIQGPIGRADLAVPASTPLSVLMPVLLRHVTDDPEERGVPWLLQKLGEEPLDLDATPLSAGLMHGDVLYLARADDPLPSLHFDDISDGVAHAIGARGDRWRPELTRWLTLALSALVMAVTAADLLAWHRSAAVPVSSGVIAVLLLTGCILTYQRTTAAGSALMAGLGAYAFAGLAGLTAGQIAGGHGLLGVHALELGGTCAGLVAVLLLVFGRMPVAVPGTMLAVGVIAALEAVLTLSLHWNAGECATTTAVAMYVLGHFGPHLALRVARLRVPVLPRNAGELQHGIDPEPEEAVTRRVTLANACLTALAVSSALTYAAALWLLARDPEWIGWVLNLVFSAAVLLRARDLSAAWQRVPTAVVGTLGPVVLLALRTASTTPTDRWSALAVFAVVVAGLLVGAQRLPNGRLLPIWGHVGDLTQMAVAVALLPLLLQVLHVYGYMRSLAG